MSRAWGLLRTFRPRRGIGTALACAFALLVLAGAAGAVGPSKKQEGRSFFDVRLEPAALAQEAPATASMRAAQATLLDSLGFHGVVDIDRLTGTPRVVARLDGFLTGPREGGAKEIALGYVREHADAFGLDRERLRCPSPDPGVHGHRRYDAPPLGADVRRDPRPRQRPVGERHEGRPARERPRLASAESSARGRGSRRLRSRSTRILPARRRREARAAARASAGCRSDTKHPVRRRPPRRARPLHRPPRRAPGLARPRARETHPDLRLRDRRRDRGGAPSREPRRLRPGARLRLLPGRRLRGHGRTTRHRPLAGSGRNDAHGP